MLFRSIVNKMTFSIRVLAENIPYTATLVINGIPSSLSAIIANGLTSKSISIYDSIQLNQEDLVTILTNWEGGALNHGVAISLIATKN